MHSEGVCALSTVTPPRSTAQCCHTTASSPRPRPLLRQRGTRVRGPRWRADTLHAFRPEQIKSATGNNGNFDPKDPDIRFSRPTPRRPMMPTRHRQSFPFGATLPPPAIRTSASGFTTRSATRPGPLLDKLGLKAASPELRHILRRMKLDVAKGTGDSNRSRPRSQGTGATKSARWFCDLIEKELKAGTVPPEHAIRGLPPSSTRRWKPRRTNWSGWKCCPRESVDRWRASTCHGSTSPR